MKAITTKFQGPAGTRPSRITASDQDSNRVTISKPMDLDTTEAQHFAAVEALCRRMHWFGSLACGTTGNGTLVWVWVPSGASLWRVDEVPTDVEGLRVVMDGETFEFFLYVTGVWWCRWRTKDAPAAALYHADDLKAALKGKE